MSECTTEESQPKSYTRREDAGLFIGLTTVPTYSNSDIKNTNPLMDVIDETFTQFKSNLEDKFNESSTKLASFLYQPINYYAVGSFSLITYSYVDDFHFGNFSFRPYNRYLKGESLENSNFQYQVINGFHLDYNKELQDIDFLDYNYTAVVKLKINSSLLIGGGVDMLQEIKANLKNKDIAGVQCIVTESFSWHEISCIYFSDSLLKIQNSIKDVRAKTFKNYNLELNDTLFHKISIKNQDLDQNNLKHHVFTDTETIYGINPKILDDEELLKNYISSEVDDKIRISTKIHVKTGHIDNVIDLLHKKQFDNCIDRKFRFVNGKRDLGIVFKNKTVSDYIQFWKVMHQHPEIHQEFRSHIRKIHSNVSMELDIKPKGPKENENLEAPIKNESNTSFHSQLFKDLKFGGKKIKQLERSLKSLHISKDVSNPVLTLFTNFNDIICDINLYCYYVDLRALLDNIYTTVTNLAGIEDTTQNTNPTDTRKVRYVSDLLLKLTSIFEVAYSNRFLDSKRNGYNLDTKGQFNGGVHQILQAYDGVFKGVSQGLTLNKQEHSLIQLPIVSYGDYTAGIKSTINVLHLNYFQLFQPEFFLFALPKEAINYLLDKAFLTQSDGEYSLKGMLDKIKKVQSELSYQIHNEPDLKYKTLLYKYFPVDRIKTKLNYILYYVFFIKLQWENIKEKTGTATLQRPSYDIDTFTFWLWNIYSQTSNLYNTDGSLSVSSLRQHYFSYFFAICNLTDSDIPIKIEDFKRLVQNPEIIYHLFDHEGSCIHNECVELYNYLLDWDENIMEYMLTELIGDAKKILRGFNASNNDSEYKFVSNFLKENKSKLRQFKDMITTDVSTNAIATYLRHPMTGRGMTSNKNLTSALFDPQGGLFIRDAKLRMKVLSQRLEIIKAMRDNAYNLKLNYILTLVKHSDEV